MLVVTRPTQGLQKDTFQVPGKVLGIVAWTPPDPDSFLVLRTRVSIRQLLGSILASSANLTASLRTPTVSASAAVPPSRALRIPHGSSTTACFSWMARVDFPQAATFSGVRTILLGYGSQFSRASSSSNAVTASSSAAFSAQHRRDRSSREGRGLLFPSGGHLSQPRSSSGSSGSPGCSFGFSGSPGSSGSFSSAGSCCCRLPNPLGWSRRCWGC